MIVSFSDMQVSWLFNERLLLHTFPCSGVHSSETMSQNKSGEICGPCTSCCLAHLSLSCFTVKLSTCFDFFLSASWILLKHQLVGLTVM